MLCELHKHICWHKVIEKRHNIGLREYGSSGDGECDHHSKELGGNTFFGAKPRRRVLLPNMAIRVVEFSNRGYKIRKIFA